MSDQWGSSSASGNGGGQRNSRSDKRRKRGHRGRGKQQAGSGSPATKGGDEQGQQTERNPQTPNKQGGDRSNPPRKQRSSGKSGKGSGSRYGKGSKRGNVRQGNEQPSGAATDNSFRDPFINPYNFISLGDGPSRGRPPSQEKLDKGRLSGRINYELTALSPLAIGGAGEGTAEVPIQPIPLGKQHIIPGSSIAGVVRAFHEALTDSCLRMIDLDYVPVHRDPAAVPKGEWRMGVICRDGKSVRLCEPVRFDGDTYPAIWVEARWIKAQENVKTGARFDFCPAGAHLEVKHRQHNQPRSGRVELKQGAPAPTATAKGEWITLVSQALPGRVKSPQEPPPGKRQRQHPYHLPLAKLGTECVVIPDDVLAAYQQSAEGTQDVATRKKNKKPDLLVTDRNQGKIGERQEVKQTLPDGTVVWVEIEPQENNADPESAEIRIGRLSRSVLWRSPGEGLVSDRIASYAPCTKPDNCCPSCQLFGMASTEKKSQKAGRHEARRGRVRFGMACIAPPNEQEVLTGAVVVKPLLSPKPSSGQLYLEYAGELARAAKPGERPLRDWGSAADEEPEGDGKPEGRPWRRIRGRKRYWPVDIPKQDKSRYSQNDGSPTTKSFKLVARESTVSGTIHFESLTEVDLGALLASIDPNLLLCAGLQVPKGDVLPPAVDADTQTEGDLQPLVHMIGGGKPYGLGAVRPSITCLEVWKSSRYEGSESAPTTNEDAAAPPNESEDPQVTHVKRFVEAASLITREGDETKHIDQLLAMSQFNRFPATVVKYPPEEPKPRGQGTDQFAFWQKSSGAYLSNPQGKAFTTLPDAAEADPRIKRPWINGNGGAN